MMTDKLKLLKNLDLLFVEDDEQIAETTMDTLSFLFNNVTHAKNGIEALDVYQSNTPDMILTDIKMPEMDGLEFAKIIRENDYITPIIFLTSFSEQKFLMDAVNISSDGYFVKPINLDNMIEVLSRVVQRNSYIQKEIKFSPSSYYNYATKELFINHKRVDLGNKEQALLKLFISNVDKTLSKEDISYYLYPLDSVTDSAIKNLVTRLRDKIGKDSISHIRGSGWKIHLL